MKLLIVTQKVDKNDAILGFFHRWVEEFAKHCEKVSVICLEEGVHDLPENVRVYSLGKESGKFKLLYLLRFYKFILSLRKEYDSVFVHMNPEYVVLAGDLWRLMGKRIALWYTHREKNLKLRLAEQIAHIVFTASKESFTLPSKKLKIVGHGIDTNAFICPSYKGPSDRIRLIQVGRITLIKHCENAIEALTLLEDKYVLRFIGAPHTKADQEYFENLNKLIAAKNLSDRVEFSGIIPNKDLAREYCEADATLNLVPTGGVDKAVLESMAAGRIALSSNQAFADYFGPHKDMLLLRDNKPEMVAAALRSIFESGRAEEITAYLTKTATSKASVGFLISNIIKELS